MLDVMAFMQAPERRAPNVVLRRLFHRSAASKYYRVLGSNVWTLLLFQTPDLLLALNYSLLSLRHVSRLILTWRRIRHSHGECGPFRFSGGHRENV